MEAGTNWATDASSGGALEGRNPSAASEGATMFAASAGTAGTAGTGDGATAGGGLSRDATWVCGAGLGAASDAVASDAVEVSAGKVPGAEGRSGRGAGAGAVGV